MENELQNVLNAVVEFDKALGAYQKDGSGQNKKIVIEKYNIASSKINDASSDIRGEISEPWGKVDLCMRGFTASSGTLTKLTTFGASAKNADTQIDMIRSGVAATLKVLKGMANASAGGATVAVAAAPAVDDATKAEAAALLSAVTEFDKALGAYQKDGSSQNKKIVIEKYNIASSKINDASSDIRGEISEPWGKVDLCMRGFTASSGKLTKLATFGASAKNADTQIDMIRSGVAATIKALKPMAAAAATVATTSEVASVTVEEPVVAPVEETIQEAPVEEAVQEAPVEEAVQEAPVEEAVYEESLEETPVEEPVVAPAPAPVQQKPIQQQRPVQQQRPAQRPVQKQAAPVKKAQKKSPPPKKKKKKVPVAAIILPIIALLLVAALIIVPIVLLIVGGIVLGVGGLIVWGIISLVGGTETYDIYEIKNVSGGYAIVDIIDDSYQSTVEIPDYINGKPVVEIREHAFSNANIDYVILPETMKMVKTFAFEGSDIIGVGISGATTIQSNAFNYCSSLNYVAFSGENATIEYDAFYHCYNILAFEISAESITVEYDAVPSNSSPVMLAGPAHVCDGEKISLDNTTDLYITSGAIEEVVDGDSVRRLIIGSEVERIDSYAFDDCNYVTSVTFEDTYGWVAESPYDGTESFYSSDLSNASTNADLLLDQYNSFYWYNN